MAALGLAAVALAGSLMDYLSWPLGLAIILLSLGAAVWLRRRAAKASAKPGMEKVEGGLRIVEKALPAGKSKLPYGLRVTISTEVGVVLGPRGEPLAQTGRGSPARQGVPAAVRESRQAWLFVVQNSPRQRELFLRLDLFASQPIQLVRVEQIRPGGRVALPEWKELELRSGAAPDVPAGEPGAATGESSPPSCRGLPRAGCA